MSEEQDKIKSIIASVISPFATASAALLAVLSAIEYFRRGFVSLFLDFRILAAVALVLWIAAVCFEARPRIRVISSITVALALAAVAPILWRLSQPYGRLGLLAFLCGLAALVV